jgi:flagellar hook-length control protein FliK
MERRSGDVDASSPAAGDSSSASAAVSIDPTTGQPVLPNVAAPGAAAFGLGGAAPGAPPTGHAAPHVVSNVTLAAVPVEIGMKSLAGINEFNIRLAPNDLGQIEVKLHIDEAGRVKAHLVVDHPETLGFLHRDTAQLQQALEQAGLTTQDGGIALSLRNSGSDGAGQNRNQNGDQQSQSGQPDRQSDQTRNAEARPAAQPVRLLWPRATGVDVHI